MTPLYWVCHHSWDVINDYDAATTVIVEDVLDDDETNADITPDVTEEHLGRGMKNRIPVHHYRVDFSDNTYKKYDKGLHSSIYAGARYKL